MTSLTVYDNIYSFNHHGHLKQYSMLCFWLKTLSLTSVEVPSSHCNNRNKLTKNIKPSTVKWQLKTQLKEEIFTSIHQCFKLDDGSWVQPNCVTAAIQSGPHLAIFQMACATKSRSRKVKALAVLQQEHRAVVHPTLQPEAPVFAIRVCALLAVLAQRLCGRFWMCSRATGAGRGPFPTTHVAAIKRRKGPGSKVLLLLPALSEIPQSRCFSNWTHFQSWKEEETEVKRILPEALRHVLFSSGK